MSSVRNKFESAFKKEANLSKALTALSSEEAMPQFSEEDSRVNDIARRIQAMEIAHPGSGQLFQDNLVELGVLKPPVDF